MRMLVVASETLSPLSTAMPLPTDGQPEWCICSGFADRHERLPRLCSAGLADGPFPFTVAVWQELFECSSCGDVFEVAHHWNDEQCGPLVSIGGRVVATVEVTGPSHRPETATGAAPGDCTVAYPCHPAAAPDCWHTPSSAVSRLDVPIPMERPPRCECEDPFVPAPFWWADTDLEVPA